MNGGQIKPGYKRTEVGVIPEDWSVSFFRSVVGTYIDFRGRTPRKLGMDWGGGDILALSANNVQMGEIDTEKEAYFGSSELYKKWMTQGECEKGDVLITMEAPLGNIAQVPDAKKYILSQRVLLIKPKAILARDFLAHYMRGSYFQGQLVANSSGSTALGIQRARLDEITVALPPLSEQLAIATTLSDVDALLDKLDQLIAKKRDLKQAAMQQLLTGQIRLPGFSGEWEVKRLGNVLCVRHGKSQYGVEISDGKYPILATSGEIGRSNTFLHNKSSVLIGRKGTIDKPQFRDEPFWTVDTLFYTEIVGVNSAKFLYYIFCQIDWRSYNEASGVPSLNASTIESIEVRVPLPDEQTAIATVISDMDADLANLEARRDKTYVLKQGMMQELLTGRIRLV